MQTKQRITVVAFAAACALATGVAHADSMFLKFTANPAIVGDSIDRTHAGEIDVDSYAVAIDAETSWTKGGGAAVGKPNPGEFKFTAFLNSSVPMIMRYIASGNHADTAVLTVRDNAAGKGTPNGAEYLKITMQGVFFTNVAHGGSTGGDLPMSTISMVYKTLKVEFKPILKDGSLGKLVCTQWDIPAGTVGAC